MTDVKIDFDEGKKWNLVHDVRDRIIITPPYDNKMESVTIFADKHISVNREYREKNLEH